MQSHPQNVKIKVLRNHPFTNQSKTQAATCFSISTEEGGQKGEEANKKNVGNGHKRKIRNKKHSPKNVEFFIFCLLYMKSGLRGQPHGHIYP